MDPSSTDFRAFFPYTPNEVKHRKRTTGTQLKVLEGVFKQDTKPNAALRKQLASQLDMTPRGVQVWFQNRRAKEKNKASKITASIPKDSSDADTQLPDSTASPPSSEELDFPPESPACAQSHLLADTAEPIDPSCLASSSGDVKRDSLTDSPNSSWRSSPDNRLAQLAHSNEMSSIQIASLRRGSLPVNVLPPSPSATQGPPVIDHFDPLARRRSVDASLHRLSSNPYAPLARAKNGALYASRVVAHGHHHPAVFYAPLSRPSIPHRVTMPNGIDIRRASLDSRYLSSGSSMSPSPSPLSPFGHRHAYAISSRPVPSQPLPGPLPSPNFSFGAPVSPSIPSSGLADDRGSPDSFNSYTYRSDDADHEDDSSTSYGSYSRFGSIASVANSDSSALYSDVSSCNPEHDMTGYDVNARRDSCAPAFLDVMSNLSVSRMAAQAPNSQDGSTDELQGMNTELHPTDRVVSPAAYPSPSSTVSPGGSPPRQESTPSVPISRSSELAFALQDTPAKSPDPNAEAGQMHTQTQASYPNNVPSQPISSITQSSSNGYQLYDDSAYSQQAASVSLSLDFAGKYQHFNSNYSMMSTTDAYQPSFDNAAHNVDPFSTHNGELSSNSDNQEQLGLSVVHEQRGPHPQGQGFNGPCPAPNDMYHPHQGHQHAGPLYPGDSTGSTAVNSVLQGVSTYAAYA